MAKWDLPYSGHDFNDYQKEAKSTAIYSDEVALRYLSLGIAGEAGEFAGKIAKHYRDGTRLNDVDLAKELGDILWFVALLADYLGYDMSEIARMNINKLKDRQKRNVLGGSGDNR